MHCARCAAHGDQTAKRAEAKHLAVHHDDGDTGAWRVQDAGGDATVDVTFPRGTIDGLTELQMHPNLGFGGGGTGGEDDFQTIRAQGLDGAGIGGGIDELA